MAWRKVQRQAMAQDFGWEEPARRYLALYQSLVPHAAATPDPEPETAEVVRTAGQGRSSCRVNHFLP
jgi:starch synthase